MKSDTKMRITAFILSLIVLACVGLCSLSTVSYADTVLNTDGIKQAQYDNWNSLPDDFKALGQAYFDWFKSKDPINFFNSASDIPISWFKVLKDGTPVISPLGQLFYYLDGGELFVEDKSEGGKYGGGGGRHRSGDTNPIVPVEDFATAVDNSLSLTTSLPTSSVSWKNNYLSGSAYDARRNENTFCFMKDGDFFAQKGLRDVYCLPFFVKDGQTYFSQTVFRYYYDNVTCNDVDYTDIVSCDVFTSMDDTLDAAQTIYTFLNGKPFSSFTSSSTVPKHDFCFINPYFEYGYGSNSTYRFADSAYLISGLNTSTNVVAPEFKTINDGSYGNPNADYVVPFCPRYGSSDFLSVSNSADTLKPLDFWKDINRFRYNYTYGNHTAPNPLSVSEVADDYGFLICPKRFKISSINSLLDGSQIKQSVPSNSYITITNNNGNLYDYSITNTDDGSYMTIGDLVNYGWIWQGNGDGNNFNSGNNGGNGGIGGDVNVSGNIGVNVSGSIDINVNGGGNGGTGVNPGDYIDPGNYDTSFDDYFDYVPEVSKGFIDYLKDFFAWLPPPVYGLLILGLIVAVFCRLAGR